MNLYWVTTEDHDEDWFIVAETGVIAQRAHEDAEGYDPGSATAELVCAIPENLRDKVDGFYPSHDLIEKLGGVFIMDGDCRSVRFDNRTYTEGLLESIIQMARGKTEHGSVH